MFTSLETGLGLDIVLALQSNQNDFFDLLAEIVHFLGNDLFYLFAVTLVFWVFNRDLGIKLLFALIVGSTTNAILKNLFQTPRPYVMSDEVIQIVDQHGYGLPSGHMMNSLVFWGYLVYYLQKRWLVVVLGFYLVLVAWARMYGGVHYPQDIIAGFLFGLLTLWIYIRLVDRFPPIWKQYGSVIQIAFVMILAALSLLFVFYDPDGLASVGVLIGAGLGIVLENRATRFDTRGTALQKLMRYIVGILLLLALFYGLRVVFGAIAEEGTPLDSVLRVVRYGVIAFFAYYVFSWIAIRFGLAERDDPARHY